MAFDGGGFDVRRCPDPEQLASFIVEAVNGHAAITSLMEENEKLKAERDAFRGVLEGAEYGDLDTIGQYSVETAKALGHAVASLTKAAVRRADNAEAEQSRLHAELLRVAEAYDAADKKADEECNAAEARAQAAEALLKEAGEALEPLCARADKWSLNSDSARVSVRLGHLRAARAIHDKIGVKDE